MTAAAGRGTGTGAGASQSLPVSRGLQEIQDRCLPEIEKLLASYLEEKKAQGLGYNSEMAAYHLSTGGKRLRALIPCWVFAAEGRDPMEAVRLGAAIEMIHNATLVHDDLQDGDTVRRGKPTVWKRYSEAQSINCGDAMFHFGFDLLLQSPGIAPERALKVVRRAVANTLRVIEGQAQEFLMKDEQPGPGKHRYLGMIAGKTGALIALPVAAALEALGYDDELVRNAHDAAMDCGLLFQIQDDLLDIYGDKKREQNATDIAEGKISILVALFNECASEQDKTELSQILRTSREATSRQQIERALELFAKYDVRGAAVRMIHERCASIEKNPVLLRRPELQSLLREMAQYFLLPVRGIL